MSDTFSVVVTDTQDNAAGIDFNVVQDTTAPTVNIDVPAVSGLAIPVSWAGTDDRSGIRHYEVQYQKNGGAWTGWLTNTPATEAMFVAEAGPGDTFRFRAKATDNVNNEGD